MSYKNRFLTGFAIAALGVVLFLIGFLADPKISPLFACGLFFFVIGNFYLFMKMRCPHCNKMIMDFKEHETCPHCGEKLSLK